MIGYLERTPEKVEAIVIAARKEGFDPVRVQTVSSTPYRLLTFFSLTHALGRL